MIKGKYKLKERSDRVERCSIELLAGTFYVDVRQVIPIEIDRIQREHSIRRPGRDGRMRDDLQQESYNAALADALIVGWQGLTVAILRDLGVLLEDEGQVSLTAEGTVAFDPELARLLFVNGYWAKFAEPVLTFSQNMQQAAAAVAVAREGNSASSPG